MKVSIKTIDKNVTATLIPEALSSVSIQVNAVRIRAKSSNTDSVFIGVKDHELFELTPGDELPIDEMLKRVASGDDTVNLQDIYIKVAVAGEGVSAIYVSRS
jgi:hypothetical protein